MELSRLLNLRPGVTALAGGGGKTTAMYALARELARRGTVVCTTTTHILPPGHLPVLDGADAGALERAVRNYGCVCVGAPAREGKLSAPALSVGELARFADYVLVEADGSKGLPVKAHLSHEPVIPPETGVALLLAGASGFGRPVREAVHRWEQFCTLTGAGPEELVTPENLARLIAAEGLGDIILVNQAETPAAMACAGRLAGLLPQPVFAGALRGGVLTCLS